MSGESNVLPRLREALEGLHTVVPDTVGDRLHFSLGELLVKVEVLTAGKSLMHLRAEIFSASVPEKLCVSATAVYAFVPAE